MSSDDQNLTEGYNENENEFDEVPDSLCMRCGGKGMTRYLIHKIPYFRELVISSFYCYDEEGCGERNNEVTFGGEIQLQGSAYTLEAISPQDLDRQLIKSDSASIIIPSLELEIPAGTQKGEISTIEGFLMTAAKNLGLFQEERMQDDPVVGSRVGDIIAQLTRMAMGLQLPFTIIVSDPAGNSFVQNLCAPKPDPQLKQTFFYRTREQNISLGLNPDSQQYRDDAETNFTALIDAKRPFGGATDDMLAESQVEDEEGGRDESAVITPETVKDVDTETDGENVRLGRQEVISIPDVCANCRQEGESLTALTDIPHFKEVIIMAFSCAHCGYKSSEVKAGGAIPSYGTEVTLRVTSDLDLRRDILKSDSAMLMIPELGLELQCGTLGGVYTTVEGMLQKIESNVRNINPFSYGDSTTLHHSDELKQDPGVGMFDKFLQELQDMSQGRRYPFTLIIRDPLGNSFISAHLGTFTPPEADEGLTIEDFVRSYEENEEYGLNDMNTRDFETGVEYNDDEVRLPDRLTHITVKGKDHPTPFAQGVADSTEQGMFFSSTKVAESNTSSDTTKNNEWTSLGPAWGPADMAAEMGCPPVSKVSTEVTEVNKGSVDKNIGRRTFHSRDKELKYIAREEFGGRREGYVFRMGGQGIGYYEDRPLTVSEVEDIEGTNQRHDLSGGGI